MNATACPGATVMLDLEATLDAVDRAVAEASGALSGALGAREAFGVLLGLREAVTNAVLHGSLLDPSKRVTCEICITGDAIEVAVADQGEGFDWRACGGGFPDPTVPGHRGIGIITTYFDEIKYNEKGNKLLLTKRLL